MTGTTRSFAMTRRAGLAAALALGALATGALAKAPAPASRWSAARANAWYAQQRWPVGVNYTPRDAINQLEMWQQRSFDPKMIDQELGWAQGLGINTVRVFLHNLAWQEDPKGFLDRMDQFLGIADRHGIRTMFVIFDDCWNPDPHAGNQPQVRQGIHNSGWVQSPGKAILGQPALYDSILKPYVEAVVGRFANDRRVLLWDLYNEPGNTNGDTYGPNGENIELADKARYSIQLLTKVFAWARAVNPSQPLTSSAWHAPGGVRRMFVDANNRPVPVAQLQPINRFILDHSDVVSWHEYESDAMFKTEAAALAKLGRPLIMSEYFARSAPNAHGTNNFQAFLPFAKAHKVGAISWGFVAGKTQTNYPWSSWQTPVKGEPDPWFHDILRKDGTPYRPAEAAFLKSITK